MLDLIGLGIPLIVIIIFIKWVIVDPLIWKHDEEIRRKEKENN